MAIVPVSGENVVSPRQTPEFYENYLAKHFTKPYTGSVKQFDGMAYSDIYKQLWNINVSKGNKYTPQQVMNLVFALSIGLGLSKVFTAQIQELGTTDKAVGTGIAKTVAADASFANPLAWLASGAFWIRVGEVLLGLALVTAGSVKLMEGTQLGKTVAANVGPIAKVAKYVK